MNSKKFIDLDTKAFDQFAKDFNDFAMDGILEQVITDVLNELGEEALVATKARTPVGDYGPKLVSFTTKDGKDVNFTASGSGRVGGELRRNFYVEKCKKVGDYFEVLIYNNKVYAGWVEDGHRIVRNGSTIGWVEGQFMLQISMEELADKMPDRLDRHLNKYLKELF